MLILKQRLDHTHFEKIFKTELRDDRRLMEPINHQQMHPPYNQGIKPPPPNDRPPGKGPRPLFSFYGIVLFYMASISLRFIQKWQQDEKKNREIEKEKIATELTFLKQQINPHFLFNALNSIYSMTISTSESASNTILKLSSILRYMLYETENKLVKLQEEIAIIHDYIELQRIRLPLNVKVDLKIIGDPGNNQIAPLLLIPLIENAFKYGVDNVQPANIEITITVEEDNLGMVVSNRVVQKEIPAGNDSGIGIKNIKRRLELLYEGNYHFETAQINDIFTVTLQLKMKK